MPAIDHSPLAYLITWTTYRSWLPGDPRGWIDRSNGVSVLRKGDPLRHHFEQHDRQNVEPPVLSLTPDERQLIAQTICDHCAHRHWKLHAQNVRSNHVHIVVTTSSSPRTPPQKAMGEFKAWCSRRLNEDRARHGCPENRRWWTYKGSTRWINEEEHLHRAIHYVLNCQ